MQCRPSPLASISRLRARQAVGALLLAAFTSVPVQAQSASGFLASPEGTMGLRPSKGPRHVVGFDEAMGLTIGNSFDLKVAQERMFQTELLVRKAWSSVLPRLSANVSYNFSWPEVKFQGVTQSSLDAQVNGQRAQLEGQAQVYDAQARANEADGDYNSAYANRAIAAQLRQQKGAIANQTAPDGVAISPVHVANAGLNFSMTLFNGRSLPLLLNAYDTVKSTRATMTRARTQALYLTSIGYFNAVAARRLIGIAQHQLDNLDKHLAVTRVRVEVGTLPPLSLKRAEGDVVRARASLRTSQNAYDSALSSLGMTMGLEDAFEVGDAPPIPVIEEQIPEEELIAQAEQNRPDFQAAKLALTIAERGKLDALAQWLPTVTLNGAGRATSNIKGFQSEPLTYSVILQANLPLYDGGDRYTAYREAGSKVREAQIALAQARQKMTMSVRGNLREVAVRKANIENQRLALSLSEQAAVDTRARFEVGAATQLEVLDAEQTVTAAALDLSQAELELQMSRLALSFTVGVFNPVVGGGGGTSSSPVDLAISNTMGPTTVPVQDVRAVSAPMLAPPGRAARMPMTNAGMQMSLQPSAADMLRTGLVDQIQPYPNP